MNNGAYGTQDPEKIGARIQEIVQTDLGMTRAIPFEIEQAMEFHVRIVRQGVGCHIGSILYSTKLSKPVSGEVSLEDPKTFSSSKFQGDANVADKLNANKDLVRRVGKFARTEAPNFKMTAPRLFKIAPGEGGAEMIAATLPRSYAMAFKVSLDVKEFADLAALAESSM